MVNLNYQTLFDWSAIRSAFPSANDAAIDDYYAKTTLLTLLLEQSAPVFGTGSPEGVITSTLSQLYIDTDTNTWYSNAERGVNTGWVAK